MDVNPKACEILGYTREELLKLTYHDILLPEQEASLVKQIQKFHQDTVISTETKMRCKSGQIIDVEIASKRHFFDDLSMAVFTDITERKATEICIRQNE
ncbi:MAG: PAS domain S-box protein [Chloroflexota bacterium]